MARPKLEHTRSGRPRTCVVTARHFDIWTFRARRLALARKAARWLGAPVAPYPPPPQDVALNPIEAHLPMLDRAPLALSWAQAGGRDAAAWQQAARDKLKELLQVPRETASLEVLHPAEFDAGYGVMRRRLFLRAADGLDIPVHLLWREGSSEDRPALIYLAGSTSGVHVGWGEVRMPADYLRLGIGADMARQAARAGYLIVAVELAAFGEREERRLTPRSAARCIDAHNRALWLGRSLTGERVADVMTVVDWIARGGSGMPHDAERIYLFGHSSGGTIALFAAAVEPRIAGVVVSGALGFIREGAAVRRNPEGDGIVPGLLNWMESDDVVSLVAPRPFVAVSGTDDHIFPFAGAQRVVESARDVYRHLGQPDALRAHAGEGPHRYYPDVTWEAMAAAFGPPVIRR